MKVFGATSDSQTILKSLLNQEFHECSQTIYEHYSFMSWIGILTASGLIWINGSFFENTAQDGFFVLSLVLLGLSLFSLWVLPDFFVKFILMLITRFFYRFQVRGLDNLPAHSSALLFRRAQGPNPDQVPGAENFFVTFLSSVGTHAVSATISDPNGRRRQTGNANQGETLCLS